jgi:chemotaxis protein methyltransferase WspC
LVEAVVVPETWFFRDAKPFTAMARVALTEWLPQRVEGKLRLLSLPCSTGEEPYTMAMALLDAGFPPERFQIDAIDISGQALDSARRGIYGRNSFRGDDLGFRERHFAQVDHGHQISETVRRSVHLAQGNLFDAGFLPGAESYDIIFCRNLLIYFDAETQRRAITVLKRLLAADGMLFVGHAETSLLHDDQFASAKIAMAFAFRMVVTGSRPPKPDVAPARPHSPRLPTTSSGPAPSWLRKARDPARHQPSVPPTPSIEALRRMADRGLLAEAAQGCEAYLRGRAPSPEALHLLGLISDARGNPSAAAQYYRKALYLEPDHHEALNHLALLLKKQGDAAGAKLLGDRMRRLDARIGK